MYSLPRKEWITLRRKIKSFLPIELIFPVISESCEGEKTLRTPIDTGCRMGLCVRTGVFAESSLQPARFPVLIQTANGEFCKGGSKGLDLTLTMSVQDGDRTKKVRLEPYWCYEAGIKEVDLIIGYPYLKVFA